MDGKGTITVSVRVFGDYLRIGVRDNGPGIAPNLAEKIHWKLSVKSIHLKKRKF